MSPDESTHADTERMYETVERVTVAEAPGLRVRRLGLAPGQCVPWHYHNHISDTFFCMEGPMVVSARDPEEEFILEPGDTLAIPPGRAHRVSGHGPHPCRFIVIQGVGEYDYVPLEPEGASTR